MRQNSYKQKPLAILLALVIGITWIGPAEAFADTGTGGATLPIIDDAEKIYNASPFYAAVEKATEDIYNQYESVTEYKIIGKSVDGNNISAVRLGTGKTEILVFGTTHGRESMTAVLLLDQLEEMARAADAGEKYERFNARRILENVSIWFVPLLNPDGAEIAMHGATNIKDKAKLFSIAPADYNFKQWKSNLNGVDLNRNFSNTNQQIGGGPSYGFYSGPYGYSEPETQAFINFCKERSFKAIISYHAAGNVVYCKEKYADLGTAIESETGYDMVPTHPVDITPTFDMWTEQTLGNVPTFTIEITEKALTAPIPYSMYWEVWQRNRTVPMMLAHMIMNRQPIKVEVNGTPAALRVPAVIENGVTLVPLRSVTDAMSLSTEWNQASKAAIVSDGAVQVTCTAGAKMLKIQQLDTGTVTEVTLELPARVTNWTTYVPIRKIAEAFGYEVSFDYYSKTIHINSPQTEQPEGTSGPAITTGSGITTDSGITSPGGLQ